MKLKSLIAALILTLSSICAAAELTVEMARYSKGPAGAFMAFTNDAEVRISAMNAEVALELNELVAEATATDRYVKFNIEGSIISDVTTYHWRTGYYRVITFNVYKVK